MCFPSAASNLKSHAPLCKMIHHGYLDEIMRSQQHTAAKKINHTAPLRLVGYNSVFFSVLCSTC